MIKITLEKNTRKKKNGLLKFPHFQWDLTVFTGSIIWTETVPLSTTCILLKYEKKKKISNY